MTTLLSRSTTVPAEAATLAAALLAGLALLWAAGFSPALHAAAHDSRHAVAFPCH